MDGTIPAIATISGGRLGLSLFTRLVPSADVAIRRDDPASSTAMAPGSEGNALRRIGESEGWSGRPVISCACDAALYRSAAEVQLGLRTIRSGPGGAPLRAAVSATPLPNETTS